MKAYAKFNSIPQANKYDLYKVGNEETPIATLESSESGILEIEILNPVKGDSYYLIATDVNGNYINSP
jgi:hypothetical protein